MRDDEIKDYGKSKLKKSFSRVLCMLI